MFEKRATFMFQDFQPLNKPALAEFVVDQRIKVAENIVERTANEIEAAQKEAILSTDGDNTEFDLEAEITKHPNSLYVKCFAIKADEENDNGDYFSQDELIKATPTFVGVPVFTNHQNTDVNQARGKVVHSWWDAGKNGIMIIARVDAEAYPQLARGIKEEYIVGTSMGCQVHHSICSICHNYAETADQYCEHIRERKTRQITAKKVKCAYHKQGPSDEPCPICGSTKKEGKTFDVLEKKAYEFNYGVSFIENSFVVNPACHDCGVEEVIDPATFQAKVSAIAERLPGLLKAAASLQVFCDDSKCVKLAGQEQLNKLNEALDLLTSVSTDMLQQKDQIDLEFLSDLVKVLADLQGVTDELTQQGYGRLPSPGQAAPQEASPEAAPAESPGMSPVNPTPGGGSKVESGPAGGAGTVTAPMASKRTLLEKVGKDLMSKSNKLELGFNKLNKSLSNVRFKFNRKQLF